MLFNITNHPYADQNGNKLPNSTWSEAQVAEAARLYGPGIMDLGFPTTTTTMSIEDMCRVAHEVARDVAGMAKQHPGAAAMVAGHFVMTVILVRELQAEGIRCVVGDSNRVAAEVVKDGKVVVEHRFEFARFLEYPNLVYSIDGNM